MDRSTELRLPTVAVAVRLALVGSGGPGGHEGAPAELFVPDRPRQGTTELVDDLAAALDADDASFVPVRNAMGIRLLGKRAMSWIAIATEEPTEVTTLYDREYHVELELASGARLRGTLLDSSPADRPRLFDHLNRARHFLRLWTPEAHYLVNKTQIVAVTELEDR